MKTVENVLFEENDIPCLVILHFKRSPQSINVSLLVTMNRLTRYYVNHCGGGEIGPVYWASFRM